MKLQKKSNITTYNHIKIRGNIKLKGKVAVDGSKNSALPLIAASSLTDEIVSLSNVPDISDVSVMCDMIAQSGGNYSYSNGFLKMCNKLDSLSFSKELAHKVRASILFLGPVVARKGEVSIPLPGGDKIGPRPINIHLEGLEELGVESFISEGVVYAKAKSLPLKGASIVLKFPSVGATQNIMMAATLAQGETIIENAAREPEIVDLALLLTKMGAKVTGAGTSTVKIKGVKQLNGAIHEVIPDRLEAGTLMIAIAITGGKAIIKNVIPEHNKVLISLLKRSGVKIQSLTNDSLFITAENFIKPFKAIALPYPGLPTDLQPLLACLALKCPGVSEIKDIIHPERFSHIEELEKMGAAIERFGNLVRISGDRPLIGTAIKGDDIRSVTSLICAGLIAKGTTEVSGINHLHRGHGHLIEKLQQLNADIDYDTFR
ncbi:UDP-N-acetylglucosamine 1-carboxyvinyltransferase [Bacillus sp. MHSD_36]|uniref:UDP-N-acetylglucosamine 1-carboxyvinyltransferase n=1 Tax=unclassified Bacillus (in: firmicutes) TaxID=185979 RepID=UPI0027409D16|nr:MULTISPECIES: UDP-N-acetylglucosamine 1-carboxyvinyltransferase [unclassified Bacillus (in: firmicutes)]MDP7992174.1 UDP-N-acetylglucosamine 1-carboxyvinyltransferase [Bacillus sp. MHSD_36]MDR4980970.1 UDP-N-acetylglucosamine 1-carboxyvinyltransferase [Bacillus sp. MHSD_37]